MAKFFSEASKTQQHDYKRSNINFLVERIKKRMPVPTVQNGQFGHFDQHMTLQQAMDLQNEAMNMFNQLPAKIRMEFRNDPMEFLGVCNRGNTEDIKRLEKVGILQKKEVSKNETETQKEDTAGKTSGAQ